MDTDFQNLISRFKDFPVIEHKPSFLEIARFPSRETVWRNFFAFFFDPNECHGFKDLFLRSFFDALGKENQSTGDFDSMEVRTECRTEKGNFLDLLILCDEFAIGIEMKVNAGLYNDLEDYSELIKAKQPADEHKVVLSIRPCPERNGFTNLLYPELIAAIQKNLGNYILGADPKYTSFLLDFLTHMTHFIGGYAMTIDPKQLQFMQDNHETIKRLIETHNTINGLLEQRMAQISDNIVALDTLKGVIAQQWGLFTYKGSRLIKFCIKVAGIRFFYEMSITPDYCNSAYYWFDEPQHLYLNNELERAGFTTLQFTLSQSVDEVVAAIEKMILSMVDYLNKKPMVQDAQ